MHLLVVGILFVAAFELSLRGQSATINALNISTFTPLEGSLAGGTRLAIYGAGFDNQFTGSLSVAIGPYPCQVLVTQSSAQVVTCEASPGLSGTYWVSVTSRGPDGITATAAAWGFTYTASRTPVMRAVQPSAGPPGASIAIIGNPVDVVTRDCGPTAWGDSDCLGGIRVGRLLCAVPEGDISRIYDVRSQRLRSAGQTFQINCTMPQPQRNNPKMPSVVPGLGTAGMYNVTLAFEATSRGGRAGVHSSAWLYKADGTPYMYEQYPEVSYITPSAGSSAGGTLVTIYGRGFPDFRRGLDDKVEIQISPGMPCVVQDSVYDKITCMTSARPDKLTPDVSTAVVRGLYSGMRGAEYEVYPTGPDRTPGFRELWKLNTTIRAVDLPNGYVGVLMDTMEGRTADYGLPYHCSRMKGFFRAPRDANYTFYAAADDYAQLNGTWIQDGGGEVQQVLLNVTSPTALLDWKNLSSSQASAPIRLSSGQPILLELNHCNVLSYGTAQLGVRVSSSSPATNSLSEVQRIHVTSARVPRSVAISYMYVSSSSPPAVAVQVLVSADSPTRFSDRRLGLQLVLNVLNGLATVKLPVAATAAELTATTIAALLESHNGTVLNYTTFGIRKSISGTTLTLELGGDKEVLKAMNVVSFRLLDLGTHVIVPSITDCEFANPLLQPVTGTEAINAFTSLPSTAQTQAEALDLNLFTVTHRSAATVQTSTPAGSWQLSVQTANGSFNVDTLPYNATAEQVATAVTNLTGIEVAVYRSSNVRQGAYLATVWNITWPRLASGSSSTGRSSDSAAVTVLASPGVGFPSAAVLATEDRAASAAPSGTIRVSFGGECEWTELNVFKDPLDVIQAKLGSLPGFKAPPRDAIRVANDDGSVDVAFSYDSIANPGDQPLLRVVDTRGLVGEDPTAWVVADSTGSTDQVFFPIPVDMIHLPIPLENTITLSVNGAAAACTHPSGTCSYAYEGSLTPKITSVRPTTLSFGDGQTSALLTILGKGFTPANSSNTTNSSGLGSSSSGIGAVAVTVGGANCSVVSSNDTAVSCALQRGAVSAGKHSVVLSVPGKGYASGAGKVVISNLMISDMPPLLLSAQGMTQISINGEGFGSTEAECSNLRLLIGDVACWTVSCTPTSLTAIFPGGPVGVNLPVKLQVLESGTVVVDYTAATVVAAVDDLAPAVLLHTASVGALGGDIMLTLLPEGMTADLIASISLVPAVNTSPAAAITGTGSSIANISTLAVAMAKAYPCSFSPADDFAEAAAGAVTTISSTAGPLPRGGYYVRVVLTEALSGLTLLSSKTLTVDLAVTDINPKVGSVGGGTSLKISGRGFSPRAVDNLVFLSVPVSTTFRTGRMPCDVLSATATEIECRTRPYFLAEVDMEDPHARKLTPTVATDLAVDVVACTWTDDATSSLETCLTKGSMARCEASSSQQQSCLFSYTASATPVFGSITPSTGQGGTEVHVLGRNLGSVVEMRFLTAAGDIQAACAASEDFGPPGTEAVMCEVPADLPLGNYSLVLITDTGGASVDPYGASTFSCQASMISVQPSAVSLAGGLPLTVTVSGADLQSLNLSTFSVTLGAGVLGSAGLPCTGLTASSATELSCMAPALTGWVLAEVWKSLDDDVLQSLDNYGDPDEVLLVEGDDFSSADSGLAAPAGAVPGRMWAGRATFYMQLLTDTEAVVSFSAVNLTELWVDGSLVGGVTQGSQTFPVTLSAGLRKLTLAFHQTTQSANTSFKLSGDTSTLEGMAWAKVTPVAPGTPLQVMVTVNGAPFEAACDEQHVPLLSSANQQASLNFEPTAVNLAAGSPSCSVVYSAYKTPTLAAEVFSLSRSGVQLPNRTASVRTLYAYGSFLSSALESEVTITVGGLDCGSKTTAVIAASASSVSGNGGTSITRLACTVPPLPLGDWPVVITVAGYGATRLPLSFWTDSPVLSSNLTDDGLLGDLSALQTTCQVSLFGGGALDLTGTSNIADLQDAIASQQLAVSWDRSDESATGACVQTAISNCSWLGRPTPPQAAVNASKLSITLDWAGGAPVVSVGRYKLADLPAPAAATTVWPELLSYIDNAAVQSSMKWRIKQASSTAAGGTSESWGLASMCGGYTPYIYELSPTTANPDMIDGEVQAQVRWRLTGVGSADGVLQTADISTPSLATLEFEPHDGSRRTLTCIQPTVISSTATETTYDETFSCRLPPYMTATQYTVWLCVQPYGCGYYPGSWGVTYQPLGFQEGFPTSGPATGGTVLGVKSSGHSMDPTAIKVRFGNSSCTVLDATINEILLETVAVPYCDILGRTDPSAPFELPLSIIPAPGAIEVTDSSMTFTFLPKLDLVIFSVSPARGSIEGGTLLTIAGSGFQGAVTDSLSRSSVTTVLIGDENCDSVTVVSDSLLTCVAPAATSANAVAGELLQVTLYDADSNPSAFRSSSNSSSSAAAFQYVALWSSAATWSMGRPPQEGEDVVIANRTAVLLDTSPPPLGKLTVSGLLLFDEAQPNIDFQARAILVDGGNITAGSVSRRYSSNVTITLLGSPGDSGLPLYGTKVLAVREGSVELYGVPKLPPYTTLNATADPGNSSVLVNGPVNWQVGDRIVIASSSIFADEVDEATVVSISSTSDPRVVRLGLDQALSYTHLGVIVTPTSAAGSSRPIQPLDMRAVVAVLTRNIVLRGDSSSKETAFGAQVFVHSPPNTPRAIVRLENVEMSHMGQALGPGRFSLHWHQLGTSGSGSSSDSASWIRYCSIHEAYARGLVLDSTSDVHVQQTVTYNVYGHAFTLENGAEVGNLFDGNVGIFTRSSSALADEDLRPATFRITNPNNTLRNNIAAGSDYTGFAYLLPGSPGGASSPMCPQFTPMPSGGFSANKAHSHLLYGLRLHPQYFPRSNPCQGLTSPFQQVAAVFEGFTAFKNGYKGAVASQVGLVQFRGMALGDNGAGPVVPVRDRKDVAAEAEIAWVLDDRPRRQVQLAGMAGLHNSTLYGRTVQGARGTAGRWPNPNPRIVSIATQSAVPGQHALSQAALSLVNITFVNYATATITVTPGDVYPQYYALEACARCLPGQGGATTLTAGIRFISMTNNGTAGGSAGSSAGGGVTPPRPAVAFWSWAQQGVYEDTDGTLLAPANLAPYTWDWASSFPAVPWFGATFHSAVSNDFFDPSACTYLRGPQGQPTTNNGAICAPSAGPFRRIIVDSLGPAELTTGDLWVVDVASNRSLLLPYKGTEDKDGYMLLVPSSREYWIHWRSKNGSRVDPTSYRIRSIDALGSADYLYITTKYIRLMDNFTMNGTTVKSALRPLASPTTTHGSSAYNRTFAPNTWRWVTLPSAAASSPQPGIVSTFNDTTFTTFIAGSISSPVLVNASVVCSSSSCGTIPVPYVEQQPEPFFRWSLASTWPALRPSGKPAAGDNVTIPEGFTVLLDESTPPLASLVVRGSLIFDVSQDIDLRASLLLIAGQGLLSVGSSTSPCPRTARILLSSGPAWTISDLILKDVGSTPEGSNSATYLGSKVIAVLGGGTLDLHGRPLGQRWTRLLHPTKPGDAVLRVDPAAVLGWQPGDRVLMTSTSYNQYQSEVRYIIAILPYSRLTNDTSESPASMALVLNAPLVQPHGARLVGDAGGPMADLRAEVALLSSNVIVAASEAYDNNPANQPNNRSNASASYSYYGNIADVHGDYNLSDVTTEHGVRLLVSGNSTARVDGVLIEHCGQVWDGQALPCLMYDGLLPAQTAIAVSSSGTSGSNASVTGAAVTTTSYISNSAILGGVGGNIVVNSNSSSMGVGIYGNVLYGSYGASNVWLRTGGNALTQNLALGCALYDIADHGNTTWSSGELLTANYHISSPENWIEGNVAAGSDRFGFILQGLPCTDPAGAGPAGSTSSSGGDPGPFSWTHGSFLNNTAHSCLAGLWLRASAASRSVSCTALSNFTAHANWDFGIITMRGIDTDVRMYDVHVLDTKHAGVTLLRQGSFTEPSGISWRGGLLAGRSSSDVCAACSSPTDAGCHKRLSRQSYNRGLPYTPSVGILSSAFALGFSLGPEYGPWEAVSGYPTVFGHMNVSLVTLLNFEGYGGCAGGSFAMANNPSAPDAFHPHFFWNMRRVNVSSTGSSQGLFLLKGPDPSWRNLADCGTAVYSPESGVITATNSSNNNSNSQGVPLNCAGPAHAFFRDVDGSLSLLSGQPATLVGAYPDDPRVLPVTQGSLVPGDQRCSFNTDIGGYVCGDADGFNTRLFVLASLDAGSEVRGPNAALFNVSGVVDVVLPTMDQGWCFESANSSNDSNDICSKRLAVFWTYLPINNTALVSFAGSIPHSFQIWLPYASPAEELLLLVQFPTNSSARRFAWVPGSGRSDPLASPPELYDGPGHGSYHWDPTKSLLYVKVFGCGTLEVQTEAAVLVGFGLSLYISDFNANMRQHLLTGLAGAASLLPSQLQIFSAVPGSVQVNLLLYPNSSYGNTSVAHQWPQWSTMDSLDAASQAALVSQLANLTATKRQELIAAAKVNLEAALVADTDAIPYTSSSYVPPPPYSESSGATSAAALPANLVGALLRLVSALAGPDAAAAAGAPVLGEPKLLAAYDSTGGNLMGDPVTAGNLQALVSAAVKAALRPPPPAPRPPPPATLAADIKATPLKQSHLRVILPAVLGGLAAFVLVVAGIIYVLKARNSVVGGGASGTTGRDGPVRAFDDLRSLADAAVPPIASGSYSGVFVAPPRLAAAWEGAAVPANHNNNRGAQSFTQQFTQHFFPRNAAPIHSSVTAGHRRSSATVFPELAPRNTSSTTPSGAATGAAAAAVVASPTAAARAVPAASATGPVALQSAWQDVEVGPEAAASGLSIPAAALQPSRSSPDKAAAKGSSLGAGREPATLAQAEANQAVHAMAEISKRRGSSTGGGEDGYLSPATAAGSPVLPIALGMRHTVLGGNEAEQRCTTPRRGAFTTAGGGYGGAGLNGMSVMGDEGNADGVGSPAAQGFTRLYRTDGGDGDVQALGSPGPFPAPPSFLLERGGGRGHGFLSNVGDAPEHNNRSLAARGPWPSSSASPSPSPLQSLALPHLPPLQQQQYRHSGALLAGGMTAPWSESTVFPGTIREAARSSGGGIVDNGDIGGGAGGGYGRGNGGGAVASSGDGSAGHQAEPFPPDLAIPVVASEEPTTNVMTHADRGSANGRTQEA